MSTPLKIYYKPSGESVDFKELCFGNISFMFSVNPIILECGELEKNTENQLSLKIVFQSPVLLENIEPGALLDLRIEFKGDVYLWSALKVADYVLTVQSGVSKHNYSLAPSMAFQGTFNDFGRN